MNLDMDSILTANNDTLGDFYTSNIPQSVGIIYNIEKYLGAGNFNAAISEINAFEPNSNFENNYKTFFQLYYDYKMQDDSLGEDAIYQLALLAAQCPFNDGPVVYSARNLYDKINGYTFLYNDDECYTTGYSERTSLNHLDTALFNTQEQSFKNQLELKESLNKKVSPLNSYVIFPNPSFNEITIKGTKENEQIELTISDILGRVLLSKKLSLNNYSTNVKFNLPSGIYFAKLLNKHGKINVQKLIIKD